MGHVRKQYLFDIKTYPIYNLSDVDTWLHVPLKCKQQHIHALITTRHNKTIGKLRKAILLIKISRHYTFINQGSYIKIPQENTI